jgi:hypothetical protein
LEGWQVQWCRRTFGIGSQVHWDAGPEHGDAFIRRVLGEDLASTIEYVEDHHGQIDERIELAGEVIASEQRSVGTPRASKVGWSLSSGPLEQKTDPSLTGKKMRSMG